MLSIPLIVGSNKREFELINVLNLKPPLFLPNISALPKTAATPPLTAPARFIAPVPQNAEVRAEPPKQEKLKEPQPAERLKSPEPVVPTQLAATEDAEAPRPVAKPSINTESFPGSSAPATMVRAAHEVQTGGFGNPLGNSDELSFSGNAMSGLTKVAALGSFDLPIGPGQGNGSGGARGARGTVVSAGFGNGVAGNGGHSGSGQGGNGSGRGGVRSGGFGDQNAMPQTLTRVTKETEPALQPVEIVNKPKPIYTKEARDLRLEGIVVLEVLFNSSGQVRVLRIVRGLGHGLDEAAVRAAEEIRFKPAQRDGRAVDHKSTVQIIFRLA